MPQIDRAGEAALSAAQEILTGAMRAPLTDDEIVKAVRETIEIVTRVKPHLRDRLKLHIMILATII